MLPCRIGMDGYVREILANLPVYMMVGIVAVIAVSQFHRIAGAMLGLIFWLAVAMTGTIAYDRGHAIGFPGLPFSRSVFLLFCGAFAVVHVFAAWQYLRAQRRRAARRAALDEDG